MSAVPPAVRKVSERAFQGAVIDLARTLGYQVFHVHDSRRQVRRGVFVGDKDAAGMPDLILARERVIWAELKSAKGRVSEAQQRWIDTLEGAGQEVYVFRPCDWDSGRIQRILAARNTYQLAEHA